MKQICFDARMALHSGIGTYIRNLLPYIQQEFPALQVLANRALLEQWPSIKEFNTIVMKAPIYSIQEQLELPLRVPPCHLFWSPHYNIPLLPLRAKKRLVTIHDVYHLVSGKALRWTRRAYANLMFHRAVQDSDHIVTVSHFSKSEIIRTLGTSQDKISVIYNGVNQDLFSVSLPLSTLEKARSLYQLPEKYMLFVSSLAPHKNLNRLLCAWNTVIQKHRDWHLIVVGKSKHQDDFQLCDLFPQLKSHVHHLKDVADDILPALYRYAYALIYPSTYEGFGLPPLEAMSMECPAIVSSAASLPEICQEAALYVDPYHEQEMAQKICTLMENPSLRQTLIHEGKKRVDHFNWKTAAEAYLEIIHRMLG